MLTSFDAEAIRTYLKSCDQYTYKSSVKSKQLQGRDKTSVLKMDVVRPVDFKYFVDPEQLQSVLEQGTLEGTSYESVTDEKVSKHYEGIGIEFEIFVGLENLARIVGKELNLNMRDNNART